MADKVLVDRCLAGEVAAWEELYLQCHDSLLATIDAILGEGKSDRNLVDEIAARVWYALVANDGQRLSAYSPDRGARLITFMRTVARDELGRHFRAERRRRRREILAAWGKPRYRSAVASPPVLLGEFMATLTPQERDFCADHLLGASATDSPSGGRMLSAVNIRQITHQVYRKFVRFMGSDSQS
ncbi:MAG: hypothetical protein JW888_03040 [Pirellulales bacterium]|nr:hypothetical protein [Pirellulales bacterium]